MNFFTQMNIKIIALVFIAGCTSQRNNINQHVAQLRETLPQIETPIKFDSDRLVKYKTVELEDNALIKRLNEGATFSLLGKMFETEKFITILGYSFDSVGTPILVTFDNDGNQLSSHKVFETVKSDSVTHTSNIVTILSTREIKFTDSTIIKRPGMQGVNVADGHDSLAIVRKGYLISDNGVVEELDR